MNNNPTLNAFATVQQASFPPSVPNDVTITVGDGSATVSYTTPYSTGGAIDDFASQIDYYQITVSDGTTTDTYTTTDQTYTVSGLVNATAYTITVAAHNGNGVGPAATVSTATPAPTGVVAASEFQTLKVSFTSVIAGNYPTPISYRASAYDPLNPATVYTAVGGSSPLRITGLTNGVAYNVYVETYNGVVYSRSDEVSGQPKLPFNGAGTNGDANAFQIGEWSIEGTNIHVQLYRSNASAVAALDLYMATTGGIYNHININFASNSYAYDTGGELLIRTDTRFNRVPYATLGGVQYDDVTIYPGQTDSGTSTYNNANQLYLSTTSGFDTGAVSAPTKILTMRDAPSPPSSYINGVSATYSTGKLSVYATIPNTFWTASLYAYDGAEVIYNATNALQPYGSQWELRFNDSQNAVQAGAPYYIQLRDEAYNAIGVPAYFTATPGVNVPDAPTITGITADNGSLAIAFTAPANNGGSEVLDYTFTASYGQETPITATGSTSPITITGLMNGQTYTVSGVARNSAGNSLSSIPVSGTPEIPLVGSPPGAPEIISVTPGIGSLTVAFTTPTDGGAVIIDYTINLFTNDAKPTLITSITGVSGSPYQITGLTAGATYNVSVAARNSIDTGTASQLVAAGTVSSSDGSSGGGGSPPVPTAPVLTSVSAGDGSLTLVFTASNANGGSAVSGYEATASIGSGKGATKITTTGASSPITISGLTNGTEYTVYVRAYTGDLTYSANSNSILATPTAGSGGGLSTGGGGKLPPPTSDPVPCFFGDAPVLTRGGYVRMDEIAEGDKVLTPEGEEVAVERAKCYRVAAGPGANPYVIPKGRFGATEDLLISPDHRVQTAEGMVEAKKLGLQQEEREGFLTYYNLELAGGANMVVAGVAVESLAHVRRMVVPRDVFERLVAAKYGNRSAAEVAQMIARTCRTLEGDRVEIPVMRK